MKSKRLLIFAVAAAVLASAQTKTLKPAPARPAPTPFAIGPITLGDPLPELPTCVWPPILHDGPPCIEESKSPPHSIWHLLGPNSGRFLIETGDDGTVQEISGSPDFQRCSPVLKRLAQEFGQPQVAKFRNTNAFGVHWIQTVFLWSHRNGDRIRMDFDAELDGGCFLVMQTATSYAAEHKPPEVTF